MCGLDSYFVSGLGGGKRPKVRVTINGYGSREVSVPADLAAALDREPSAREAFGRMPDSHQLRYVTVIEDARTPETRQRRIDKTISALRGG